MDQLDRDRVEEMELFSSGSLSYDEPGFFQQPQVLHNANAGHVDLGLEFAQGTALTLKEQVEQETTSRVSQRLEDPIVVVHPSHDR